MDMWEGFEINALGERKPVDKMLGLRAVDRRYLPYRAYLTLFINIFVLFTITFYNKSSRYASTTPFYIVNLKHIHSKCSMRKYSVDSFWQIYEIRESLHQTPPPKYEKKN